jgi:UDP-N-acetyl-D-glucosamine dehydrogenase
MMEAPTPLDDPQEFFAKADWTLGVIGMGYVGLPLLIAANQRGLSVTGYDTDGDVVARLKTGQSHVDDVTDEEVRLALESGGVFSSDSEILAGADAIVICVPSPFDSNRQPDLSYISAAADTVTKVARPGQLVVLESTSYPGTTTDYIVPAVAAAGLEVDRDVWVAFSPERISPGHTLKTRDLPKIVGGVTPLSTEVAAAAYRRIVSSVHTVSSPRIAEMAKLLENTYRSVNIALANEMAQLAHSLDIDIWEVIEAADTKPFGFEAFWPGPGVGGHCIPLDPQYLSWRARKDSFPTRFIDLAEQVNSAMPKYNEGRITDLLNTHGRALRGAEVLAVGIAYKPNIADDRESASILVIRELERRDAVVSVMDPVVGSERIASHGLTPVEPDADLSGFALAVILTDHDGIDYGAIADSVPLVYDSRGAYRRRGIHKDNVTAL